MFGFHKRKRHIPHTLLRYIPVNQRLAQITLVLQESVFGVPGKIPLQKWNALIFRYSKKAEVDGITRKISAARSVKRNIRIYRMFIINPPKIRTV